MGQMRDTVEFDLQRDGDLLLKVNECREREGQGKNGVPPLAGY